MVARRGRVRLDELGPAAHPCRRDRRHLADRQRGRALPGGGTGRAVADGPRPSPNGDVRLVQPRRLRRDGVRGARRRLAEPGPAGRRHGPGRRVPRDRRRLRPHRDRDGRRVLAREPGRRSPTGRDRGRRHPSTARAPQVEADRPSAVGPLLHRCLRRRLHPAEPDGVLVPRAVRRGAGAPRARSSSGRTCSRPCPRCRPRGSRRGSG